MTITVAATSPLDASIGAGYAAPVAAVAYQGVAFGRLALIAGYCRTEAGSYVTPAGWSFLATRTGGSGVNGNATGFGIAGILWRILDGTESGTVAFGGTGFTTTSAGMVVLATDDGTWEALDVASGEQATHVTNRTATADDGALDMADGDAVLVFHGSDRATLPSTLPPTFTLTAAGCTFGAPTEVVRSGSTRDIDTATFGAFFPVTTGVPAVPTGTFSTPTPYPTNCGPTMFVRVRDGAAAPLNLLLTGIPAPSPAVSPDLEVEVGSNPVLLTGIMSVVNFGAMVMEQGIGVQLTGIPAPSPAVSPNMVIFREGEEPQEIVLTGIPAPTPAVSGALDVTQGVVYTDPPCDWPVIACGEYPDGATGDMIERAERWATELLWMRTGMRFGNCPVTIRPCQVCTGSSYEEWPVLGDAGSSGSWVPFLWSGAWTNVPSGCGCGDLHRCSPPTVKLPTPAESILSVVIDGVTLDPSAYRVDDQALLVRQDGQGWPTTQDLSLPAGQVGTFEITYQPGPAVPLMGKLAAGALALEHVKACMNIPCRFPGGVASIVRQGVEMTLIQEEDTSWLTGVKEADDFLNTYNPHKLRQAPVIYSPDVMQPRVTTWSAP